MPTTYSIIQFSPNPLADERVNIGVIVSDGVEVRTHFVANAQRLRCLAGPAAVRLVRDFEKELGEFITPDFAARAATRWSGSFIITEPRGSLSDTESLLHDLVTRFLVDPPQARPGHLVKSDVQHAVKQSMLRHLRSRFGGFGKLLLRDEYRAEVGGERYLFDFAIANGAPRHLIQSLSFQVEAPRRIEKETNAAAWSIEKVRQSRPTMPITVVAAPPKGDEAEAMELYEQAARTYNRLGVSIVSHEAIEAWSEDTVERLPDLQSV